ncbi:MAG: hypothetical protein K2X71_05330 [Methylobacterium sp.]|jgi:hypothetical protein|uniref:hypothetical protein n=1 Tax=Methylobacterium sp. TaxID=409 RepID=UPI0025867CFB|nr:hypothetical protein [Methylobacterium sp.]MBY0295450.1 hypothetical protein [Methylobacterium sp.]
MNTPLQEWHWSELRPLALIAIVIASWALYHFLAPQSWRDWAGVGAVQAFIIALYTEMYGFTLTIYVLTSFLHVPIPLFMTADISGRRSWGTVLRAHWSRWPPATRSSSQV